MRRYLFVPALVVAVAVFTVAAGAAWLASGTGTSFTRSTTLGKPTSVAAAATGSTSVQVTWGAPTAPSPAPISYDVFRYIGVTGTKVCSAVPAASPRVCNDSGLSPGTTYGYTVEARLGTNWMSGQTTQVNATTNAAPSFLVEQVVAGNKTAGTAFQVRITARNGTTTDTTYTGAHNLTFSGPGQNAGFAAPTYPASGTFAAGVATVSVTLRKAETATLTVAEGARTGTNSVTVVAGPASLLRYTGSNSDCSDGNAEVGNGGTFTSFVSRLDASGNAVVGAVATVNLSRSPTAGTTLAPTSLTIDADASQTSGDFDLTIPVGNPTIVMTATSGALTVNCTVRK